MQQSVASTDRELLELQQLASQGKYTTTLLSNDLFPPLNALIAFYWIFCAQIPYSV